MMNSTSTPILISTITAFVLADSLRHSTSTWRAQEHQDDRGQIDSPALLGVPATALPESEAEQVVEKFVQVLRPADGDGRGGHAVPRSRQAATPTAVSSPSVAYA